MSIETTTHLNFDGDARAALDFYATVFGGEVAAMTYAQMGASDDAAWADRIVFGQVSTTAGLRVIAFDVWPGQTYDAARTPSTCTCTAPMAKLSPATGTGCPTVPRSANPSDRPPGRRSPASSATASASCGRSMPPRPPPDATDQTTRTALAASVQLVVLGRPRSAARLRVALGPRLGFVTTERPSCRINASRPSSGAHARAPSTVLLEAAYGVRPSACSAMNPT